MQVLQNFNHFFSFFQGHTNIYIELDYLEREFKLR